MNVKNKILNFLFSFSKLQTNVVPKNASIVASTPRSYSSEVKKVTLIPGDGIGPEISAAVQQIFKAANVPLEWETVDVTPVRVSRCSLSNCIFWINFFFIEFSCVFIFSMQTENSVFRKLPLIRLTATKSV